MFENTIRYNIDEKEGEIIEEEELNLKRISELCHIHEYINSLPFKYNSIISENGVSLSQGQRQRIGVARALFNKPSILILDEALSNLNVDMAIDILKNIRRELPDTTIVLITHTKELVEWCDDEKVLEKDECIMGFVEAL
jgi:ABC-type bacteriocin/lantibiotic exporter with double-glycine peptidase domain